MQHLFLTLLLAVAVATPGLTLAATDATGTWTGTLTRTGADQPMPAHMVLKQDGDKLTGTAGPDSGEQRPIRNGKAENGTLTFELANDESVMKFILKQKDDEITGDVTREREGQTETGKIAVKRGK